MGRDRHDEARDGPGCEFSTVSVPALQWPEVRGRGNVALPPVPGPAGFDQMLGTQLAGANFMVTTQLTGCALSFMGQGANVWMSHAKPGNGLTAAQLAHQFMQ